MRIMALHTIHLILQDRVMLRQVKLGLGRAVTLETGGRVFAGIHYELSTPAPSGDVKAAGAVTRFTPGLARPFRAGQMNPSVGTGLKNSRNVGMAFGARAVPHKSCTRHIWSGGEGQRFRGAGIQQRHSAGCEHDCDQTGNDFPAFQDADADGTA